MLKRKLKFWVNIFWYLVPHSSPKFCNKSFKNNNFIFNKYIIFTYHQVLEIFRKSSGYCKNKQLFFSKFLFLSWSKRSQIMIKQVLRRLYSRLLCYQKLWMQSHSYLIFSSIRFNLTYFKLNLISFINWWFFPYFFHFASKFWLRYEFEFLISSFASTRNNNPPLS